MSSAPDPVRTAAARVLAAVLAGRSLKAVLGPAEAGFAEGRDRGLLHSIVLASVRGALRWRAMLKRLLERPLSATARPVEAALISALAQLETLALPEHAVVDETVAVVRALGFPKHAALSNAVLRRWLRERALIATALAADEEARHLHPRWLLQCLRQDWPHDWPAIVAANNAPAPMWLRVNPLRSDCERYRQELAALGIRAQPHPELAQALYLPEPVPVARLPGFAQGHVSVQDGAAQYAATLLAAAPGQRVLDACAAPGGKSAQLLEVQPDLAELVALDQNPERLRSVADNLTRLGLSATLQVGDAGDPAAWWDGRPFQRILLDAPCSATGILRRQPDVRLHRRASDIAHLAATQARLLHALWPLLAPGGRLLYAVCSLLTAESVAVLASFLSRHEDAQALPVIIAGSRALAVGSQILPGATQMDGFAYAVLAKA